MEFSTCFKRKIEPIKEQEHPVDVVQSLAYDTDINNIFDKYVSTGEVDCRRDFQYGDTTITPTDIANANAILKKVEADFNSLPSNIRAEFGNNIDTYVKEYSGALTGNSEHLQKLTKLNIVESVSTSATSRPQFAEVTAKENFDVTNKEITTNSNEIKEQKND